MSIRFPEDPALRTALAAGYRSRIMAAPADVDELTNGHVSYVSTAERLARREPTRETAQPQRWRYLSALQPVVTVWGDWSSGGSNVLISAGPFAEETSRSIAELSTHPSTAERDYEYRLLDLSCIYIVAVWLYGPSEPEDLFYVLQPARRGVPTHVVLDNAAFHEIIWTAAERHLSHQGRTLAPRRLRR